MIVENASDSVSDIEHGEPNNAGVLIDAVITLLEEIVGGTGYGRQWAIENADHLSNMNFFRQTSQEIAAALAFLAMDHGRLLEVAQNRLKEFFGNLIGLGDGGDQCDFARRETRQIDQGLEPVFPFFCQHGADDVGVGTEQLKSTNLMDSIEEKKICDPRLRPSFRS